MVIFPSAYSTEWKCLGEPVCLWPDESKEFPWIAFISHIIDDKLTFKIQQSDSRVENNFRYNLREALKRCELETLDIWKRANTRLQRPYLKKKNCDVTLAYRLDNVFLTKSCFTFGTRRTEPGECHIYETGETPLLFFVPKNTNDPVGTFRFLNQKAHDQYVLEPKSCYLVGENTSYLILTIYKSLFVVTKIRTSDIDPSLFRSPTETPLEQYRGAEKYAQTMQHDTALERRPLNSEAINSERHRIMQNPAFYNSQQANGTSLPVPPNINAEEPCSSLNGSGQSCEPTIAFYSTQRTKSSLYNGSQMFTSFRNNDVSCTAPQIRSDGVVRDFYNALNDSSASVSSDSCPVGKKCDVMTRQIREDLNHPNGATQPVNSSSPKPSTSSGVSPSKKSRVDPLHRVPSNSIVQQNSFGSSGQIVFPMDSSISYEALYSGVDDEEPAEYRMSDDAGNTYRYMPIDMNWAEGEHRPRSVFPFLSRSNGKIFAYVPIKE